MEGAMASVQEADTIKAQSRRSFVAARSKKKRRIQAADGASLTQRRPIELSLDLYDMGANYQMLHVFHRRNLTRLLRELLLMHQWEAAAGVVAVLLTAEPGASERVRNRSSRELQFLPEYRALIELVLCCRDQLALSFNNVVRLYRKILTQLEVKPSGFSSQKDSAPGHGPLQMELAFFLMKQGEFERAYDAVKPLLLSSLHKHVPIFHVYAGLLQQALWLHSVDSDARRLQKDAQSMLASVRTREHLHLAVTHFSTAERLEPDAPLTFLLRWQLEDTADKLGAAAGGETVATMSREEMVRKLSALCDVTHDVELYESLSVLLDAASPSDSASQQRCLLQLLKVDPTSATGLRGLQTLHDRGDVPTSVYMEARASQLDTCSGDAHSWGELLSCLEQCVSALECPVAQQPATPERLLPTLSLLSPLRSAEAALEEDEGVGTSNLESSPVGTFTAQVANDVNQGKLDRSVVQQLADTWLWRMSMWRDKHFCPGGIVIWPRMIGKGKGSRLGETRDGQIFSASETQGVLRERAVADTPAGPSREEVKGEDNRGKQPSASKKTNSNLVQESPPPGEEATQESAPPKGVGTPNNLESGQERDELREQASLLKAKAAVSAFLFGPKNGYAQGVQKLSSEVDQGLTQELERSFCRAATCAEVLELEREKRDERYGEGARKRELATVAKRAREKAQEDTSPSQDEQPPSQELRVLTAFAGASELRRGSSEGQAEGSAGDGLQNEAANENEDVRSAQVVVANGEFEFDEGGFGPLEVADEWLTSLEEERERLDVAEFVSRAARERKQRERCQQKQKLGKSWTPKKDETGRNLNAESDDSQKDVVGSSGDDESDDVSSGEQETSESNRAASGEGNDVESFKKVRLTARQRALQGRREEEKTIMQENTADIGNCNSDKRGPGRDLEEEAEAEATSYELARGVAPERPEEKQFVDASGRGKTSASVSSVPEASVSRPAGRKRKEAEEASASLSKRQREEERASSLEENKSLGNEDLALVQEGENNVDNGDLLSGPAHDSSSNNDDLACNKCGSVDDGHVMVLCDGADCHVALHTYCMPRPIKGVPRGEWYCPQCRKKPKYAWKRRR